VNEIVLAHESRSCINCGTPQSWLCGCMANAAVELVVAPQMMDASVQVVMQVARR
jgi:hypothetical protein